MNPVLYISVSKTHILWISILLYKLRGVIPLLLKCWVIDAFDFQVFELSELESTTEYDAGYTKDSPVIK